MELNIHHRGTLTKLQRFSHSFEHGDPIVTSYKTLKSFCLRNVLPQT